MHKPRRRRGRRLCWTLTLLWAGLAIWHTHKPLPPGVHIEGPGAPVPVESVRFLADVTSADASGRRVEQHVIHAAMLEMVRGAQDFLLLDYFLFNTQGGPRGPLTYGDGIEPASRELIDALRELRQSRPDLPVLVLTDPINDYYRGTPPPDLAALQSVGVDVVVTRLDPLRDSNPLYSAGWRMLFQWWLPTEGKGRLPNVLDGEGPKLRLGALLRLPNFKANHRKVMLTGDGQGSLLGIVSSANPHDASSAHSNVALRLGGEALRPLFDSELALARAAGWRGEIGSAPAAAPALPRADIEVDDIEVEVESSGRASSDSPASMGILASVLTEGAIRDAVLRRVAAAREGDAIDIAQFYLSEREVIDALVAAAKRGVAVRLLLDSNRDAFGFEKSGVPNRPVAHEMLKRSDDAIALRWYRTHGEQFHAKLAMVRSEGRLWVTLGSANFTRRNLDDLNLEANVSVEMPLEAALAADIRGWFDTLWSNAGGIQYTDAGSTWLDDSRARYWQYRLMEGTGLSTF